MSWRLIGFLTAWILLLPGCAHMAKARQCRDLASAVNKALDGIHASLKDAGPEKPAQIRKTAARYAKLAEEVKRKRPTQDVELGKTVDELSSLFKQTSAALDSLANAVQTRNRIRADMARRRVNDMARSERSLATRVDALCRTQ